MPQMSPLGWSWVLIFVILSYFSFLIFFYYFFDCWFEMNKMEMESFSFNWVW